jgi:hypothetical protein
MNHKKTSHPDYMRWRKILTRYGLTKKQYEDKLKKQNYKCGLCELTIINRGRKDFYNKQHPQIDHDHSTGAIRDFLCKSCNTSLGHFEVGLKKWLSLFYYIIKHKFKHYINISNFTSIMKAIKRDYKDEYKKFQSGGKAKKYRAALNKINRDKGNYGNGDGMDEAHYGAGGKTRKQKQSVNRANNRPKKRNSV